MENVETEREGIVNPRSSAIFNGILEAWNPAKNAEMSAKTLRGKYEGLPFTMPALTIARWLRVFTIL
jgi:hypothetical protein